MGILDMEFLFDSLDTAMTGFVGRDQLQEIQEVLYFSPVDSRHIDAAIVCVCGYNSDGRCSREHFHSVLQEIDRRRNLEDKISWDFKTLDSEGNGRITVNSALFLFKTVHAELFSMKMWKGFLAGRSEPHADICFDEMKVFLCDLPAGGPSDRDELLGEEEELSRRRCDSEYRNLKGLERLQQDDASVALEERERIDRATKLKKGADQRIHRLDHEGVTALLHDDEEWDEAGVRKARQRVTATELIEALRNKYDVLREKLFLEMLKFHVGEGMWAVLSENEQYEKVMQQKLHVRKLRKEGKMEAAVGLPGAGLVYTSNLLALMGHSRAGGKLVIEKEQEMRKVMEDQGKSGKEVDEELSRRSEEGLSGSSTGDQVLMDLESRYKTDKEHLTGQLRGMNVQTLTAEERLLEYTLLFRELLRLKQEHKMVSAAQAAGLAERPQSKLDRTPLDRTRQESLARERLLFRKGRKLRKDVLPGDLALHTRGEAGLVDLLEDVVKTLELKQATEREILVYMLQGRDSTQARSAARKFPPDERSNQLLVLKTQREGWRSRSSDEKITSKEQHRQLLQEAVALAFETRRAEMRELKGVSVDDLGVAAGILCELQEHQDAESQLLRGLVDKDTHELLRVRQLQYQAYEEEWLDGVSAVVLGTEEGVAPGEEDELVKALEDKYDALRDKLLLEALQKQLGDAEWARLSERERQARLAKLKLQEKRLRQQGKFDEAAALLGEGLRNADALQALLGENRQRYLDRLKERLARRERRLAEGLDPDEEDEEALRQLEEEESKSSGNILKDLQNRFDEEKDALLRRLREEQDRLEAEKRRQAELARLRREKRQAERESKFDSAALVLGLAERNRQNLEERLRRDRERQEQLARERLAQRRARRGQSEAEEIEEADPDKDDLAGWQDAVLKALERKHRAEHDFLLTLLQDDGGGELRREARGVTAEEREKRIHELRGKRDELDFGVKADQEMHIDILDMAAAFKFEIRRAQLTARQEAEPGDDDVTVSLVADLQEEQDRESEAVLAQLSDKGPDELAAIRNQQIQARKDEVVENVASVLLRYDGVGSETALLKALDQKYDALKDKLLLDALQKQLGDAEWARLSEQERQKRLIQLKLAERQMRKDGQLEELQRLLGEGFEIDANLRKLLGDNKSRYEEKLKERLARKRERLAQGLPPEDDEEEDEEMEGDQLAATDVLAVLDNLGDRFEQEKEALLRKLRGQDERFMSERERQAELARLKRERLKAKQEDRFDTAALVLGLAERNQAAAEERLRQDRLRQEQLARERLAQRRNRRAAKEQQPGDEPSLVAEGELETLQEALMKALERKQQQEREVLVELLQEEQLKEHEAAASLTQEARQLRLDELKKQRRRTPPDDKATLDSIIQEAAALKFWNRQQLMSGSAESAVPREEVVVSLLADLQQEQDRDSETMVTRMQGQSKTELVELQRLEIEASAEGTVPNVAVVLVRAEESGLADEARLLRAVEDRYEALYDKLFTGVLIKQVGQEDWDQLSSQERMAKLVDLKQQAQKLKQEGKLAELQSLVGHETNLVQLMGESRVAYEKRLGTRPEVRRQRLEGGLSEEDVAAAEADEDMRAEVEAEQACTGNIMQDLQNRFEEERDALLADMRSADARLSSERARQAALTRLQREERQARREPAGFQQAALVLGLAQAVQANLDAMRKRDRERHKELAQERIKTRQNMSQSQLDKDKFDLNELEKEDGPVEVLDKTNVAALQEAIVKEMEIKHICEREFFEMLIREEESSEMRKASQKLSSEQQKDRLFELKELRQQWREAGPEEMAETGDEQEAMFREAVGLKVELKQVELEADGESREGVAGRLLADLQRSQDKEAEYLLRDLASKTPATLQQLQNVLLLARRERWYDNMAECLLGIKRHPTRSTAAPPSEEELVQALEQKYDALKDKLLAESLMKQVGEQEWAAMSEKERQARLVKLKLQEKKLREEGKMDEVTRILGEGLKHEAGLKALMGETKSQQQRRLQERLERLRQQKASGEQVDEAEMSALEQVAAGDVDAVDADVLNMLTDELLKDEENATTGSLLHDLQSRFDEEKEALLAMLRSQDERMLSEKQRQLALAKLRREQRRLKREDKFDTAAILLGLAKQQEDAQKANLSKDRARQEQLARDRLAALKARREAKKAQQQTEGDANRQLEEALLREQEADSEEDRREALDLHEGGVVVLQEAILNEMEKKHCTEQETLMELLHKVEEDAEGAAAARYLTEEERLGKISALGKDRQKWRMDTVRDAVQTLPDQHQTQEEKKANAARIVESRAQHTALLQAGLALLVESKRQELLARGVPEDAINADVAVILMADLQEKQACENNAMNKVLAEKEDSVLSRIKDDQRRARREGWMDNVAATILGARPVRKRSTTMNPATDMADLAEADEEAAVLEEEQEQQLADMEAELQKEKESRQLAGASDEEIQAAMAELQRQHDNKRKLLQETIDRQRRLAQEKLAARRRKRDEQQYEEDVAASIITMAQQQFALMREKTMLKRTENKDTLADRLAQRRADRLRKKQEAEAAAAAEAQAAAAAAADGSPEPGDIPTNRRASQPWPLPPGFGLKREKTVVDVDVSPEKQKEILSSLLREHTSADMKFQRERTRQEDQLMERRNRKKSRREQQEEEAATILGLGERQKTFVQQQQQEERNRQITMVRERIARVRHERTMTVKEPKDSTALGFENMLTDKEKEGLTEEEQMKMVATKMQEKFKTEQRRTSVTLAPPSRSAEGSSTDNSEEEGDASARSHTLLDDKSREKKMKERMASRRRSRARQGTEGAGGGEP